MTSPGREILELRANLGERELEAVGTVRIRRQVRYASFADDDRHGQAGNDLPAEPRQLGTRPSSGGGDVGSTMPRKQTRSRCFAIKERTTATISPTERRDAPRRQIAIAKRSHVTKQWSVSRDTMETMLMTAGGRCA